jgi:hypothetical protein
MTLFVQRENLQLIWDVITMNNMFNETLNSDNEKTVWFNSMIDIVKKKIGNNITSSDLINVNRSTIKVMIANLKDRYLKSRTDIASRNQSVALGSELDTPYMIRQKEYEIMKNTYVPPPVDFSSIEDSPIINMNELVEKHLNERKKTLDSVINEHVRTVEPIINDAKVSWATPIVEHELVVSSSSNNSLEGKVDTIMKKIDFLFGLLTIPTQKVATTGRKRSKSL